MRICLISEEEEGWGGIGTYTAVLARGLRDLGHTVHVLLRDWEYERREQIDGIVVHRITVPEPSWRRGTIRLTERLYSAREAWSWSRRVALCVRALAAAEGLDVVEAPEYRGAGAALALARRRPPLVVRLHTPAFLTERANEQRDATLDRRAVELLERLATRRADLLTAPSEAIAQAVADRWRLPVSRIAIVANPVDEQLFSPAGEWADRGGRGGWPDGRDRGGRGGWPDGGGHGGWPDGRDRGGGRVDEGDLSPTVLCVARLERVKGVDVLVEALPDMLARHPGARVVLVGEDDSNGYAGGSMAAHLRERALALGTPAQALQMRGAVPRGELPALLRKASVCVVPSRWENLPYACIEAMACACPVVASQVGGLSEVLADGVNGLLVAPGDPGALAGAICRLLDDRSLAERLGFAARTTIEDRFATHVVVGRIAQAYETLC